MHGVIVHFSVVRVAAAVYETLSPFMTEMREGLAAVKENMTNVQEQINSLTETVAKELEQNLLTNVTKELTIYLNLHTHMNVEVQEVGDVWST